MKQQDVKKEVKVICEDKDCTLVQMGSNKVGVTPKGEFILLDDREVIYEDKECTLVQMGPNKVGVISKGATILPSIYDKVSVDGDKVVAVRNGVEEEFSLSELLKKQ